MTKKIQNIIATVFFAATALAICGCVDDFRPGFGTLGEGESAIDVTVSFEAPASVSLDSRSGVDKGNVMDGISDFFLIIYHENINDTFDDGKTYKCIQVFKDGNFATSGDPDFRFEPMKYELADNRLPSESTLQNDATGRLTFKLFLESARYRVYGVANIPELASYDLTTPEQLKAIERTWLKGGKVDLTKNSEMYGVFSVAPNRFAPEQAIPLQAGSATMHCWLNRLASKVTVSFDGSDLFDDVQIFITDIKVFDVAKKCQLGNPNTPGQDPANPDKMLPAAGSVRYDVENGLIEDGGTIHLQDIPASFDPMAINPDNYIHICNNTHPYHSKGDNGTDTSIRDDRHKTDATSFFFYENLQGTGDSKFQDADGDGTIDTPNWEEKDGDEGWKDKKPYGTWVEVSGWYRCGTAAMGSAPHLGGGPIKYRFMLGGDTDKDYNVRRNHHYKLTLKFKGYGNDADWHVQYKEETGIYSMSPQYISYLYNKKMMSTVKIMGTLNPQNPYLYATIVGSDKSGAPSGFPTTGDATQEDPRPTWWRPWGDDSDNYPDPRTKTDKNGRPIYFDKYINSGDLLDGPWNTFLTLREVKYVKIPDPSNPGASISNRATKINRQYFNKQISGYAKYDILHPKDHDEYTKTNDDGTDNTTGRYIVENITSSGTNIGYVVNVPLYTRAKELATATGFTGNNPYSSYPRKMQVRYSVSLINPDTGKPEWHHMYVDIIQVRRIENPKGVWRRAGSTEGFHATLLRMKDIDGLDDYESFKSEGKWSAEVVGDPIITLSTTPEGSGTNVPMSYVTHIEGMAGMPIDFQINFTGAQGCAAVKVRYHNYTCEHDIFCRNGYDPIALNDGSYTHHQSGKTTKYKRWSSFNVYSFDANGYPIPTQSPLEAGSFFRRGSSTALLASNDTKYPNPPVSIISPSNIPSYIAQTNNPSTGSFDVIKKGGVATTSTWTQLKPDKDELFTNWVIGNGKDGEQIATIEDFYTLANPGDPNDPLGDINFPIKKAYGVVYADGAIETQKSVNMAHGYTREDGLNSPKGMRGIVVYNANDMRQIFLPIGASGYGRRKGSGGWSAPKDYSGTLRYAGRSYYFDLRQTDINSTLRYAPLFYDLFRRPGVVYWCRNRLSSVGAEEPYNSSSFDINYFTMGFEGYLNNSCGEASTSDALFIRTVFEE